jgi:hypothetical protein
MPRVEHVQRRELRNQHTVAKRQPYVRRMRRGHIHRVRKPQRMHRLGNLRRRSLHADGRHADREPYLQRLPGQ